MPPALFSHRLEAQRTVRKYASPLRWLRPRWTAFLTILMAPLNSKKQGSSRLLLNHHNSRVSE